MLVGRTIGHYTVRHKIAVGGTGSVYIAEHPWIGKRVALKVLHVELAARPDIVSRFFNEARAVNDIQHPNIVDIVDFGVIEAASPSEPPVVYLLMEYLDGESLGRLLRRGVPLPPERAVPIALQIADALAASHHKGVVHRDLKPDNIMLVPRGRERDFVKILDFGIAKLTQHSSASQRTQTGVVIGTPQYMSPEQCEGRSSVDHRTDVYALGIVLYEMLTGRVPFRGEGFAEVLVQQVSHPPVPPSTIVPGVLPHVERAVLKALAKRPEDRFQRITDMALALQDPARAAVVGEARKTVMVDTRGASVPAAAKTIMLDARGLVPGVAPAVPGAPGGAPIAAPGVDPRKTMKFDLRAPAVPDARGSVVSQLPRDPSVAIAGTPTMIAGPEHAVPTTLSGTAQSIIGLPSIPARRSPVALFAVAAIAIVGVVIGLAALGGGGEEAPASAASAVEGTPKVHLRIDSKPSGATVLVDGKPQGKTPYAGEVDKKDGSAEISVTLAGYVTATRTMGLGEDVALSLVLDRVTPTPPSTTGSGTPRP